MKIIMLSISLLMFKNKFMMNLFITMFMSMIIMLKMNQIQFINVLSNNFMIDMTSNIMLLLSMLSIMLIMLSSKNWKKINLIMYSMMLMLILIFSTLSLMKFYIMFELILIPTLIIIVSKSNQPERLQAGIYMFMYTTIASLPLMLSILNLKNNSNYFYMISIQENLNYSMMFMMAFLMKLPMFFFHLWLPKAHVEAPMEGSMILAAILLKMGAYGLIRLLPLLTNSLNKMNFIIMSISIIGASATSMNCIRQKDLKSLIAFSSVSHMNFSLASMMTLSSTGFSGALIMMLGHGFSSSALFLLATMIYSKFHTRNIISLKGLINYFPNIMFWWFIMTAMNISAPPSIMMISEIMMMSSLIQWNNIMIFMITLMSIMVATFSIIMFINISHNMTELMNSSPLKNKIHLTMLMHLIPMIILIMKLESMCF